MTDITDFKPLRYPTDRRSLDAFRAARAAERRAVDRGDAEPHAAQLTYALLTADGTLAFVTSTQRELNEVMTERGQLLVYEYGRDPMPAIPGLTLYFAAPMGAPEQRPLNLVANTLAGWLDPEGGWGRYRGTVAFLDGYALSSLTPDQREYLADRYRQAHDSVRSWQRRQLPRHR